MRISWKTAVLLLMLTGPNPAASAYEAATEQIQRSDFRATMFHPVRTKSPIPGVLVLGGAEGGDKWAKDVAQALASDGYVALAEAYFKGPGLDDQLQQIPLERLKQGIDALVRDPRVDPHRIAVLGLSKGAEAALLLAASDLRIKAVVAGSPSDVVWQGIDRKAGTVKSSWTVGGKPLTFVPFVSCDGCSLGALYANSRKVPGVVAGAAIPVERIGGPVLMLASTNDAVWPSETMAQAVRLRLKGYGFRYPVVILSYPDGGHFTLGTLAETDAASDARFGGGTADGVLAARRASWPQVLSFLDTTFHYQSRLRR